MPEVGAIQEAEVDHLSPGVQDPGFDFQNGGVGVRNCFTQIEGMQAKYSIRFKDTTENRELGWKRGEMEEKKVDEEGERLGREYA
jgi:hypothetical protein